MTNVDRLRDAAARLSRHSGPLPRPTQRDQAFDAVLALVLGLAVGRYFRDQPVVVFADPGVFPFPMDRSGAMLFALLASAPLVLRRRFPLAVLWAVMVLTLIAGRHADNLVFAACVICSVAAYTALAYSPYRTAALATLPVTALLLLVVFSRAHLAGLPSKWVAFLIVVPVGMTVYGLRTWQRRDVEGRWRAEAALREQAAALQRAVELERARIARELHDVVTHNVSVMVIQAGAARKVMDATPDQAREALLAVESAGRAAMAELRHVMGLLTPAGDGTSGLAPQPGLGRLEALVGGVRDAGVPVGLRVLGEPRPVSSGIDLAVYRVVQEALTNTVKHAVGAAAEVTVEYAADHLRVEVTDTGGAAAVSAGSGAGSGLVGLRERLAVYGGTLQTGRRPSGGFRVSALIPLEAS